MLWCPDLTTCRYGMCNNPVQVPPEPGPSCRRDRSSELVRRLPLPWDESALRARRLVGLGLRTADECLGHPDSVNDRSGRAVIPTACEPSWKRRTYAMEGVILTLPVLMTTQDPWWLPLVLSVAIGALINAAAINGVAAVLRRSRVRRADAHGPAVEAIG
ncbi:hypothetical protein Axi01nite_59260 [Actinoplanes xinjiangensis]|nr:hypothetical protein Axi01nite_59260 [Actinoplanes xinjiangensis]